MVVVPANYSGGYHFNKREKPIFSFRITKFAFRSSGDKRFVILARTPILAVRVQLQLGWNFYLFFNSYIVNFVWKTDWGEAGSIILSILFFGGALIVSG